VQPLILTIQTAAPAGSIALSSAGKALAELTLQVRQTPTEWLLAGIDNLLNSAELQKSSIDAVAVVAGPGAFTGLRVGLATAKGLAMSIGCPVLGISTLQCLAMQIQFSSLPVCVMLDARKQEVYTATYCCDETYPVMLSQERVVKPAALLRELAEDTLFVGNGAKVYQDSILEAIGEKAHFVPDFLDMPRAAAAASLAWRDWEAGRTFSAAELMPNYLRPSEAELNLHNTSNEGNSG
jgi:tRNA threonylcarbamoyladenosine biosynthesis protein TsaB